MLTSLSCKSNHSLVGELLASCKKLLSEDSCARLVPLGIKWACICAEKKNVFGGVVCLCCVCCCACCYVMCCVVIIVVVVLLVASALASMRWVLCGETMRVQKKTISAIAHKLPRREFISITV